MVGFRPESVYNATMFPVHDAILVMYLPTSSRPRTCGVWVSREGQHSLLLTMGFRTHAACTGRCYVELAVVVSVPAFQICRPDGVSVSMRAGVDPARSEHGLQLGRGWGVGGGEE